MQQLAGVVFRRLLVSLAIFLVLFTCIALFFHLPLGDCTIAIIFAAPWAPSLIFGVVSAISFFVQRMKRWQNRLQA